ncbi:Protein CBR-DYF-14 [Caenorhabditis briggsae]|uniref:Protein CBR-DYF-14 n=1 Tax=Caenorhabditis briggsae TaxID=6238 RepID=A8XHS6_CAEBR|nr:Protein CBR-DYF-14 [Caenorhabditis briggsae]CAP32192.2 Protein CBR-DYF-14 [Caenorhabditis briggsae]
MKSAASSEDVVRVTEDLSECRSRLDAGIAENRKNREVIQGINEQLQRLRQRANADSMESFATPSPDVTLSSFANPGLTHLHNQTNISMPSLTIDIPLNSTALIHSSRTPNYAINGLRNRHKSMSGNRYRSTSPLGDYGRHRSSPRVLAHYNDDAMGGEENLDELFAKLKEELFKNNTLEEVNEMLREENDAALAANEHLRVDATNLSKQLQQLQQQQHTESMRFRSENTRYRNQMESQHRKLISLWKEFSAVKRQLHELRTTTANDLDRQLTEFTRCATLMRKAIRHAEQKNQDLKDQMKREKDDVLDETLRQLQSVTENYMKAEEKSNERQRDLKRKEDEVRKLREHNDELQDTLEQLSRMANEMAGGRGQSQSPSRASGGVVVESFFKESPMDVARKMRKLLTNKNGEIDESREAARQAEKERDRAKKDLEKEEKRRKDDREAERKRSSVYSQREHDLKKLEDDLRKASEKIRNLEEQKDSQEKLTTSVQNSLNEAHRQHKSFIEELMIRHREELKEREDTHEEVLKIRESEEKSRFEKDRQEREKMRRESDDLRETQRTLKGDLAAMKTDLDDKTLRLDMLETDRDELRKKLESERELADQRDLEISECRTKLDEMQEKEAELRRELAESQATITAMEGEGKLSEEQFLENKNEINTLNEQLEQVNIELDAKNEEIRNLQGSIQEKEVHIQNVRTSTQQLSATYEEANGEIEILKQELSRLHEQLNERTRQISEANEKFDDAARKNDALLEDSAGWQEKYESLKKELEEIQKRGKEKEKEEGELRGLLGDLRANFDKLTNELKQKTVTVDSLNEEIGSLKEQLSKSEKERKEDLTRMEEQEKKNEAEQKEEYEAKLQLAEKDRLAVEKFGKECESRLNELTKIHEMLMEEHDQLKIDHLHLEEEVERLKEKMKKELEKMNEQNEGDRQEWSSERSRIETSKNEAIAELQERVMKLEDVVKEKEDKEIVYKRDIEDGLEKSRDLEEKLRKMELQDEEKEEDLKKEQKTLQEEKMKLMEQREEAMLQSTKHATTIDQQNRRISQLEADVEKLTGGLAERDSTINALESNTMELIAKLEATEADLEKHKDDLAVTVKQNSELKNGKEGLSEKWNEERKKIQELADQLREANKVVHSIRMKNVNLEEKKNELEQNVTALSNKVRTLEIQLMDKAAKNEVSGDLLRKMEHDAQSMLKQAQNEQFRVSGYDSVQLTDLEKVRKALQDENQRLVNDLATVKAAFEVKRETSKSAISDILEKYRSAEEKASKGELDNQRLRSELATVTLKLERQELKAKDADGRLKDSQKRYEELQGKLANLQRSAVESLQNPAPSRNRSLYVDIPRAASSIGLNENSEDVPFRRSPSVRFADSSQNIQRAVDSMDVSSSVGVTLRFLKERIEQLEADNAELLDALEKAKDELRQRNEKLADRQMVIERVERQLVHITEERNTIENRMTSQRQLYLTNEESARSKEHEVRSMKARISTLELHLREKESKLAHLRKEIEVLHSQLHDAIESKEKATGLVGVQDSRHRDLEEQLDRANREREAAVGKHRRIQAENENLFRKLEQLEKEREQLMREITDERRLNEKNRTLLEEFRVSERTWKSAVSTAKKSVEDQERAVQEQRRWEESHHEMSTRNTALTKECDRLRVEMREQLNRMNGINLRSVDFERKNEELSSKLVVMQNTVSALKKFEEEWKRLEAEMRAELKILRKEKLVQTAEIEDFKRRGLRSDTEKKEIEGIRVRLEREISALKRHVDAKIFTFQLEEEKGKTEKAVRETMNERRAIDKSLASMERENQQLYRNCAQLQAQIQTLERDAGNRSVQKLAKDHQLLETRIAALIEEKRQLQAMLDQKDANYSHKRKLLESQIQLLREQLEAERRKRSKGVVATGPTGGRRAVQHTSAFRHTIERHRSLSQSSEHTVLQEQYHEYVYSGDRTPMIQMMSNHQTPPISPQSLYPDAFNSGTLIM